MTAEKSIGRGMALYALACVVLIGLAGGVFTAVYGSSNDRAAIWISALVALVVQMVAFTIARILSDKGNGIVGWGIGAVICFVSLIVYGFVSRALGLPLNAALLSLATYYALTELIEPPLLTV